MTTPDQRGPAISLDKVRVSAPALVPLAKTAAVSLEKQGLTGQRAAVYLVLDHSGSMYPFYEDGSVQRLAEQALGLSVNLDDDGTVPVIFFGSGASPAFDVDLSNYAGVVQTRHQREPWGSTNYAAAIRSVVKHYRRSRATDPAFVVFQSDGDPDSRRDAEKALKKASRLPVFFAFVGFGDQIDFLEELDDLGGRAVDNASVFHASSPSQVTDADLYDGLTQEYGLWLTAARSAGIL